MFRNWLFGGQPGSGKTFALRLLLLAAALDPRAEIRGYELKGVGDFQVWSRSWPSTATGSMTTPWPRASRFIQWLYEECRRRSKRIEHYARLGKAPENKVTAGAGHASRALVCTRWWPAFDEMQELMTTPSTARKPARSWRRSSSSAAPWA